MRFLIIAAIFALPLVSTAQASDKHGHATPPRVDGKVPVEAGQGAFAALAEIVRQLQADPNTDWSRVNIAALREHLVDMNLLVLEAQAEEVPIPGGLEMRARGSGRAQEAIGNMVIAHAGELDKLPGWSATATKAPDGATLKVTAKTVNGQLEIRALGFFGLMATGAHHQPHHWALATGSGNMVHN